MLRAAGAVQWPGVLLRFLEVRSQFSFHCQGRRRARADLCARYVTRVTRCGEPASGLPSARRRSGHGALWCGRLSSPPPCARGDRALSPTAVLVGPARTLMPPSVPRVAALRARPRALGRGLPSRLARSSGRPSRCAASPPMPPLCPAPASSRRRGEPSTSRWRSPAWSSAPHACLRVCDVSPPVRIRRLGGYGFPLALVLLGALYCLFLRHSVSSFSRLREVCHRLADMVAREFWLSLAHCRYQGKCARRVPGHAACASRLHGDRAHLPVRQCWGCCA